MVMGAHSNRSIGYIYTRPQEQGQRLSFCCVWPLTDALIADQGSTPKDYLLTLKSLSSLDLPPNFMTTTRPGLKE